MQTTEGTAINGDLEQPGDGSALKGGSLGADMASEGDRSLLLPTESALPLQTGHKAEFLPISMRHSLLSIAVKIPVSKPWSLFVQACHQKAQG